VTRGNRRVRVIDFPFSDITRAQRRHRRDASAQSDLSAATKEAQELHELAVTTGSPFGTTVALETGPQNDPWAKKIPGVRAPGTVSFSLSPVGAGRFDARHHGGRLLMRDRHENRGFRVGLPDGRRR